MADRKDKRGTKPGSREGTAHAGKMGNLPHERNDTAAALVGRLSRYGLPLSAMSDFLEWLKETTLVIELGEQGYSDDTIRRHYAAEIADGKKPGLEMLMNRVYAMAFMEQVPEGVTPDRAYAISADKLMALLNMQHGIMPHQSMRHAGPGGGPIPIALIEATLTDEEIEQLARITAKLEAAAQR